MLSEREQRLVVPFYLDMMGTNALSFTSAELLERLATVGRGTSVTEVLELLRGPWRPQVMGAWFSVFHSDPLVKRAVLDAMAGSLGYLTSPSLATVAALIAGDEALPAMDAYLARDLEHQWGGAPLVAAAMAHLGQPATSCEPEPDDHATFERMLDFAGRLCIRHPGTDTE